MKQMPLLVIGLLICGQTGCGENAAREEVMVEQVRYLSPEGLHRNPAFSQVVVTEGKVKTVRVGGQNAVSAAGEIVGKGDIAAQAEQVAKNIEVALAAGGARLEHVVQWRIYVVAGQDSRAAFGVFRERWGDWKRPPLITLVHVAGLAHPDFLMEIEAVAVVPEGE